MRNLTLVSYSCAHLEIGRCDTVYFVFYCTSGTRFACSSTVI